MHNIKKRLKTKSEVLITLLYYILVICFLPFNPYSDSIVSYSNTLLMVFVLSPIIFACLPIILKKILQIDKFVSIAYSLLIIIVFIITTIIIGYFTNDYFEIFSYEKWSNSDYCDMRYKMVESLEKKHTLIGMNRRDIYNILGKTDVKICSNDYEETDKICYMTFESTMRNDFYCLYLDQGDIVVEAKYESVR